MAVTRLRLIRFADAPPIDRGLLKFKRAKFKTEVKSPELVTLLVTESDIANVISHSMSMTLGVNARTIANVVTHSRVVSLLSNEAQIINAVHHPDLVGLLIQESLLSNVITNADIEVGLPNVGHADNIIEEGDLIAAMFKNGAVVLDGIEWGNISTGLFKTQNIQSDLEFDTTMDS